MPVPRQNESRDEFIERCISVVISDGTAENQEQAVAVCYSMWENREKLLEIERHLELLRAELGQASVGD